MPKYLLSITASFLIALLIIPQLVAEAKSIEQVAVFTIHNRSNRDVIVQYDPTMGFLSMMHNFFRFNVIPNAIKPGEDREIKINLHDIYYKTYTNQDYLLAKEQKKPYHIGFSIPLGFPEDAYKNDPDFMSFLNECYVEFQCHLYDNGKHSSSFFDSIWINHVTDSYHENMGETGGGTEPWLICSTTEISPEKIKKGDILSNLSPETEITDHKQDHDIWIYEILGEPSNPDNRFFQHEDDYSYNDPRGFIQF